MTRRAFNASGIRGSMAGALSAGLASQAALMVSGVLVARMLGVEDRGYLALLILLPIIAAQLGGLGMPISLTYFVARDPGSGRPIARSLTTLYVVQAAAVLLAHLVALLLLTAGEPKEVLLAGLPTLAAGPGAVAQQYGLGLLQGQSRFRAFNILRLIPAFSYSAGILFLFLLGQDQLTAAALVWTAATAGPSIPTLLIALKDTRVYAERPVPTRTEMARFGLRGLLGSASPSETFRLDQAVVGVLLSPASLGLYVVGLAFTNLPRFLAQSVGMVAYPRVAAHTDPSAARMAVWRFSALGCAITLVVVGALELSCEWLISVFFGEDFLGAVPVTQILLIAAAFWSVRRTLTDAVRGVGLPGLGSLAEVVAWLTLPLGLAVLLPTGGLEGVALAMVISAAMSAGALAAGFLVVSSDRGPCSSWLRARLLALEGTSR